MLVVVCSTTGVAMHPRMQSRSGDPQITLCCEDLYQGVKYTVLGLGDTNYDKFCHMGKAFHKRIGELGGEACLDLHCADEATGLEDVVDDWFTKIIDTIKTIMVNSSDSNDPST